MKRLLTNKYLNHWLILIIDLFISFLSSATAIWVVGYIGNRIDNPHTPIVGILACSVIASALCFTLFKTYNNIIRHSSLKGLWSIGAAVITKCILLFVIFTIIPTLGFEGKLAVLFVILDLLISAVLLVGIRVAMLIVYDWAIARYLLNNSGKINVLVYGIGDKSVALKTRLHKSKHYCIIGFINYGKENKSYRVSESKVYHFVSDADLMNIFDKHHVAAILFSNDEDVKSEKERLIHYCTENSIKILVAPQVDEFDGTNIDKSRIREIRIEDLLGREEIQINKAEIFDNFHDKIVMVTGGAGSIGSEVCRQMADLGVKKLIIFDSAETPLHEIRLELEKRYPSLDFVPFIGDVRSMSRLQIAFDRYQPQIVFHAAAYKHVPLMEENPCEAVLTNILGSKNVADFCVKNGVEKMVMISTDKAVNPTNVMGCSKRIAEIYCQSLGMAISNNKVEGVTTFVTTRFGNVLGSNGSVIPYFRKQIEAGGPVTVTHPDINRFFMTIPEACRLVMEAATMGKGNEIFVFEMGEPVKIVDLATKMIKLAGYIPNEDINIEFTGLRPGEKLYEEVLSNEENTIPTCHHKIKIAKVREYEYAEILNEFATIIDIASRGDIMDSVRKMKELVPEFKSNNSIFEQLDKL